ncbi:glycosyltransferase family A protein [Actinokineospora sp. NBRC 105648]|uniref:glycosyltransferase family 2 protein n=1 Tax=Actinokineospora sp. NBRC 105648 TaxID=3032206 RepID=UPI0024A3E5D7|nr:glycosyltransferase family A protein [Actinokineospora sp. NBRC 105648]GLZ40634.1 glycosyl transferase [Actinokineospora sp. NBRC 105648]
MSTNGPAPTLSVIIPVFNEETWIVRCVEALVASLARADWSAQVVVVDDGSTDGTADVLADLARRHGLTVVSQANLGRFEARKAGLGKATGERVLLLDSRVIVEPEALGYLRDQLVAHPERLVWNGHITVASAGNPYAGFMAGLVKIPWRAYTADPRLTSFGEDEFDLYPKGTGFFVAPHAMLVGAMAEFDSLYDDIKLASDDTKVLRWIVERERIHLSPGFAAVYNGRDTLRKFAAQSLYRGTTYVDSYLTSAGPARTALFGALGVGALSLAALVKRPKSTIAAGVVGCAAAGVAVRRCGATPGEARAVSALLPLFAGGFGLGVLRGLLMAAKARLRK